MFGNEIIQAMANKRDTTYLFCLQGLLRVDIKVTFPDSPKHQSKGSEWMTPNQENIVELFGWTSLVTSIFLVMK
eukprot:15364428-Ditylum_brightwellii.AAC.1